MAKRISIFVALGVGLFIGFMIGLSMDPIDRAVRKAQNINKSNLKNVGSLRKNDEIFLEQIQNDPKKKEKYLTDISNKIQKKQEAVRVLKEAKEFIRLAQQEVFVEKSMQQYLYSLGRIQLENGMVYQAISNLQMAFDLYPYDLGTTELLGTAYLGLYHVLPVGSERNRIGDEAVRMFQIMLRSVPDNVKVLYSLALIYTDQGVYTEALSLFSRILDLDPSNIDALLGAARVYYEQGNIDQSRRIYEKSEALILEQQSQKGFVRKSKSNGNLSQKLQTIRRNLDILYKEQTPLN